jgi:mycothiol synthase
VWSDGVIHMPTDTWVVEAPDGRVIGHANVGREGEDVAEAWGIVHPDHRGLGIGSRLLDLVDERAAAMLAGGGRVRQSVGDVDVVAPEMLRARGFERVRSYRHMEIDLGGYAARVDAPAGIEIRTIDLERDLRKVHETLTDAFRDEWGHHNQPFEEWRTHHLEARDFDPSLWLLATEDGEPVGALGGVVSGDRGWIFEVGVRAPWRGRGIGSAMLRRSFATFADRGLPLVTLNVDSENPTGAVGVYERAGMRAVRGWDVYERTLAEA